MRKLILAMLLVSLLAMIGVGCSNERVAKPELKGTGPLALKLPPGILSPEYHQPVDYWKRHHMDILERGDYSKHECMLCHDVNTSCNNCHDYVGVARVKGYE
ncbi:MAG: hypothetical protein ACYDFU_06010 [Nitrospirota bacterium]